MLYTLMSRQDLLHSSYQIDFLIVGRVGVTLWGCYQQAVRECLKRIESLAVVLSQMDASISELGGGERAESPQGFQSPSQSLLRVIDWHQVSTTKETARELARFLAHAIVLRRKLGPLNSHSRNCLEADLWEHRAKIAFARDLLQYGRPTAETLDLVSTVPVEKRVSLLKAIHNYVQRKELLDWYAGYRAPVQDVTSVIQQVGGANLGQAIVALLREWAWAESELEVDLDHRRTDRFVTAVDATHASVRRVDHGKAESRRDSCEGLNGLKANAGILVTCGAER